MRLCRGNLLNSFFFLLILFVYQSDAQNYILKQGVDESGNVFIYSPYILWNNQINPSPSTLKSPLQIYSARGQLNVTLTVEVTRVSNELFSFNTRTFCYSDICALPGPSLYVTPGDRLTIRVVNKLGNSSTAKTASNIPAFSEELFFPNRTNVFIQGVPLDPSINSPFTYIEGGDPIYTYTHVIPDDVIPGVHWYHSRVHKLAAFQVLNGLLGAFFIIPRNTTIYPSSYTQLEHQTLVFTHLLLEQPNNIYIDETTNNGFSYLDDEFFSSSLSLKYLSSAYGSNLPLNIAYTNRFTFQNSANHPKNFTVPIFDAWFTNGQYQPVMTLAPGKWKIFDIVIASGDRMIELELKDSVGNAGVGNYVCTMSLIAKNGVQYQTPRTGTYIRHLTLFPSETASILLMCPTAGTYYLQTSSFISANTSTASSGLGQIGDYQLKSSQLLLILNITGDFFVMDDPPSDFSFIPNSIPDQGTSQYLNSNSSVYAPEGLNSIDLSISTIQDRPLPSGNSLSQASNCYQLNDSNADLLPFGSDAEYLLGMGIDCQLPCYDDILCTALYGSSNFQLDQFPTVLNHECFYASSSKDQVGTNGINCNNSINATNDPIQDSYPGIYRLQKAYDINYLQDNTLLVNLEIYGHRDFQYPMFFQSQFSQYHSFENVNLNIANIILRDDYYPLNSLSPSYYYYQTNDWQYFLLPTPGRSFFTTKINFDNNPNGIIYLLSSVLKYEDRGFFRVIEFQPTVKPPTPVPAPTPSPTPVNPNPLATTVTPWSIRNSLDKANASFLCDVTGQSFFYNETIDFTQRVRIIQINSCPNHFSVCQSMECGGSVKTRALQNAQTFLLPLYPHLRKVPIDMSCSDDIPTAIALNGVKIYSPAEEEKQACHSYPPSQYNDDLLFGRTACQNPSRYPGIIQCGNRLKTVATIVDKCGGFSDITYTQGEYRYHMLPTCLYNQLEQQTQSNTSVGGGRNITWISSQGSSSIRGGRRKHSPQIAWSLDGFPVYGPYGAKGILMRRCGSIGAHPQICVDVCNGYYGRLPDVDQYYYRYYILGNISTSSQCSSTIQNVYGNGGGLNAGKCQRLQSKCCANAIPDDSFFPYVPTCFRGCLINQTNNAYLCNSVAYFDEDTVYETSKGYSDYFIPAVSSYAKSIVSDNLTAIDAMFSSSSTTDEISSPSSNNTNVTTSGDSSYVVNTRRVLTVNELEHQFMLISTNLSNSISPVTVKYFQRDRDDFYITGMTFDTNHQNLFFTSQSSIFSYNLQNHVLTKVIAGIIEVDIFGYNFGNQRSDIEYIRLNQSYDCTSIIRFNATNLRCLFYQPGALTLYYQYNRTIPPALIEIRTISGVARGIALDAMNIVRGNIMRPVMTGMTSKKYPFTPYALKMHGNTLYWTNIANDARSVQRSFSDGSSIETIVTNVKKGSSIDVIDAYLDYNLNFFSLSPPTIENVTIVQASTDYPTTSLSTSYDDIYEGHIIFVSDYDKGEVVQLNVLPINSNAYVFALDPLPPITANITFDPTTNTTSGVRSTQLLSILQYQDTSDISAVINAIPMTVLLTDVIKVKNVYIDLTTSEFYLVMSQGLILRSDLISILTSQLIQQRNLNTVIEQIQWPVSIPVTSLLINQRIALDVYGAATSAWSSLLPWWWKIVYIGTSDSRFTGFTTIPASLVPPRFAINSTNFWNIRRLFVLDCNQERLIDILQNTFDSSMLAIGQKFDVHWPQVLLFSQSMTSSSSSLYQGIELYLSEYLGKIWKLTVQLNTVTGLIDYRYTIPELVLDVSTFTTSILLRNELNDNSNNMNSLNSNQIFYEISV